MSSSLLLILALKMAAGLLADRVFGEVRRFHPLVGFGRWAGWVERGCRRLFHGANEAGARLAGVLAWALAVLPWAGIALWLRGVHPHAHWMVDVGLLYLALGGRSLVEHAQAVATPLAAALAMSLSSITVSLNALRLK